jgi:hypothetical protein
VNAGQIINGLSASQADGLACVACETDYLRVRVPHLPGGRSVTGSQVFVCVSSRLSDTHRSGDTLG